MAPGTAHRAVAPVGGLSADRYAEPFVQTDRQAAAEGRVDLVPARGDADRRLAPSQPRGRRQRHVAFGFNSAQHLRKHGHSPAINAFTVRRLVWLMLGYCSAQCKPGIREFRGVHKSPNRVPYWVPCLPSKASMPGAKLRQRACATPEHCSPSRMLPLKGEHGTRQECMPHQRKRRRSKGK